MEDMEQKYQYLADFSNALLADGSYGQARPEAQETFLRYYVELTSRKPLPLQLRLGFFQIIPACPAYAYRNSGIVSADFFNRELDLLARDGTTDGAGLINAFVNSCLYLKALVECAEEELDTLAEANWTKIADHTHALAKELGWNGIYQDDEQSRQENQRSRLFSGLHAMNAQVKDKNVDSFVSELLSQMGSCAEGLAQSHQDPAVREPLLALCAYMSDAYASKYAAYKDKFGDVADVASLLYGKLLGDDFDGDVRGVMLYAALEGLTENFAESPATYMMLQRAFIMEGKGVPLQGMERLYAIIGHLCGFEEWHDKTYGGSLRTASAATGAGSAAAPEGASGQKSAGPDPAEIAAKVAAIVPGASGSHMDRAMNIMIFAPLAVVLLGLILLFRGSAAAGIVLAVIGFLVCLFMLKHMVPTIVMHHENILIRPCGGRELGMFLDQVFRAEGWVPAKGGPGQINYRKNVLGGAVVTPTLSVSKTKGERGGDNVEIWVSGGSYDSYNTLRRFEVVPRMKDRLLDALMSFSK